jgi:hypothetical protein
MGQKGGKRMHATVDPAERIAWQFQGGPKRRTDAEVGYLQVLAEGRKTFSKLQMKMDKDGLSPRDCAVSIVWATNDLRKIAHISTIKASDTPDADDLEMLRDVWQNQRGIPIGLVGAVLSRRDGKLKLFARPLVVSVSSVSDLLREQQIEKKLYEALDIVGKEGETVQSDIN